MGITIQFKYTTSRRIYQGLLRIYEDNKRKSNIFTQKVSCCSATNHRDTAGLRATKLLAPWDFLSKHRALTAHWLIGVAPNPYDWLREGILCINPGSSLMSIKTEYPNERLLLQRGRRSFFARQPEKNLKISGKSLKKFGKEKR